MRFTFHQLFVVVVFFTFSSSNGWANDVELKNKLSSIQTLSAQFVQRVFDENEEIYQAKGRLYVAKPQKVRWETQYPEESLMIADGTAVWNIDTFVEQITIFDQASAIMNNPLVLLTTEDNDVWSQFSISNIFTEPNQEKGASDIYQIDSLDETAQIKRLTISFVNNAIASIVSVDAQGQESKLEFTNLQVNDTLNDSLFNVDIPKNYTIDDQR